MIVELGERDCSVQRRNQKVIEETLRRVWRMSVRAELLACADRLGPTVNYRSAGRWNSCTTSTGARFYFLEVNTRFQVEHGVTEEVTGVDLVEWMVRVAAGRSAAPGASLASVHGHSIQARVYAEDPGKDFQPSAGSDAR